MLSQVPFELAKAASSSRAARVRDRSGGGVGNDITVAG